MGQVTVMPKQSQLPPTEQYGHTHKKVVLTEEQLAAASERLYTRSVERIKKRNEEYEKDLMFQMQHNDPTRKKKPEELSEAEQRAIAKLYSQPIERKAITQANLEKKFAPPQAETKTVLPEEKDAITERLYSQSMQRKKQGLEQSEKRMYGAPSPRKVLDKEHLAKSLESLYSSAVAKKKESDEKLEGKYGWKRETAKKPLSKAEIESLGQRLATKSGK